MDKNEEYDFLSTFAHAAIYDKRPFRKNKKRWVFHCINCEEKISSDSEDHTHYYLWNFVEFGAAKSKYNHNLVCSTFCVNQMLFKVGVNIIEYNRHIDSTMGVFQREENEKKITEIREKQDNFMKNYGMKKFRKHKKQ